MVDERRTVRFSFQAGAEVAPENSPQATMSARVTQIGLYGCYMETASPFPAGTALVVKIFVPGEYFEAKATVIHVQQASGMGLAFRDVKTNFRIVLRAWLLKAMRKDDVTAS